ncbi:hypothetical protein GOQ28_12975 [Bordetella sp. 02P26C-1]|nr:ankyrin repeat domain-containing protein [Bordetella sp. 02P26C-1]MVW79833.1 hypothetical protein [Bordetella sp. 02P26C-1]
MGNVLFGASVSTSVLSTPHDSGNLEGPVSYADLAQAIRDGDIERIRDAIAHPLADITAHEAEQHSLLHVAIDAGCSEAVQLLLAANNEYGFVNAVSPAGTALMCAARAYDIAMLHALIEAGADVNAVYDGYTALGIAAYLGHGDAVEALAHAGADVNTVHEGIPVLSLAAQAGLESAVAVLLSYGAQVDRASEATGHTALMHAAARGSRGMVQRLLAQGANVDAQNHAGDTALLICAQRRVFPAVSLLLRGGADVNLANSRGKTALMLAAEAGDIYTVKALLAFRANVLAVDHAGRTAMMLSIDKEVTQALTNAAEQATALTSRGCRGL